MPCLLREMSSATFQIRNLPIGGDLILAPMSGYNDQPFRRLCREFGAALTYTGLLAANAILYGSQRSREMLRFHPAEKPLVCQLFGSDEDAIVQAALTVESLGVDAVDINLGCPDPKIVKGGYGAALLNRPSQVERIVAHLVQALKVPVTGKIRLGWDDESRNYLDIARILEDNGASLIAVHGRTAAQGYRGEADWGAIAEVKQAVHVPILASGDVKYVSDIDHMLQYTGCDGVMIGRGCIGNPWIFQRRDRDSVALAERVPVMVRHLQMMIDFHGAYHGIRRFRKHLRDYLRGVGVGRGIRRVLLQCDDAEALLSSLEHLVN